MEITAYYNSDYRPRDKPASGRDAEIELTVGVGCMVDGEAAPRLDSWTSITFSGNNAAAEYRSIPDVYYITSAGHRVVYDQFTGPNNIEYAVELNKFSANYSLINGPPTANSVAGLRGASGQDAAIKSWIEMVASGALYAPGFGTLRLPGDSTQGAPSGPMSFIRAIAAACQSRRGIVVESATSDGELGVRAPWPSGVKYSSGFFERSGSRVTYIVSQGDTREADILDNRYPLMFSCNAETGNKWTLSAFVPSVVRPETMRTGKRGGPYKEIFEDIYWRRDVSLPRISIRDGGEENSLRSFASEVASSDFIQFRNGYIEISDATALSDFIGECLAR